MFLDNSAHYQLLKSHISNLLYWITLTSIVLTWTVQLAQSKERSEHAPVEPHEIAEGIVVKEVCKDSFQHGDDALQVSKVGFDTDAGLMCASKVIEALAIEKLKGDPGIISASDALWRLVDRGVLRKDRRHAVRELLEKIQARLDHPLRSEAWLGVQVLDKEDNQLQRTGAVLPYKKIPSTHQSGLSIGDSAQLRERMERSHPLLREALLWAISEINREFVDLSGSKISQDQQLNRIRRLAISLNNYSVMSRDFLEVFLRSFWNDYQLLTPIEANPTPAGSDILPSVIFTLTGKICTDGGRCQDVNSMNQWSTNLPWVQTTPLNDTISQSQIYVPFLGGSVQPGLIASYNGQIASYIGGGRWKKRFYIGDTEVDAGDGTATVAYKLEGDVKIPTCNDPGTCSIQARLISFISPPSNGTHASGEIKLKGPTGEESLPSGQWISRVIDRSLGEHILSIRMSRNDAHRGSCCANWYQHGFVIQIVPSISGGPVQSVPEIRTPPLPQWIDKTLLESLKAFGDVQRVIPVSNVQNAEPIPFGNMLTHTTIQYENRFADLWARLVFAHLARSWGSQVLKPTEINGLTALQGSLSARARSQLLLSLSAELEAWSFAFQALDPAPIRLIVGALVRNVDITSLLDDAEIQILASQKKIIDVEVGQELLKAKVVLEALRKAQPKVEALLTLMSLEEDFLRKAEIARSRIDRLSHEIAQLRQ